MSPGWERRRTSRSSAGVRTGVPSTERMTSGPPSLGVALGLAGGAAVTRLLGTLLYGVSPLDATTWALAVLLLAAVGLLASLLPAVRATRIDPLVAMRAE